MTANALDLGLERCSRKGALAPFAGEKRSRIHFGGALGARGAPYNELECRPVQTGQSSSGAVAGVRTLVR